MHVLPICYSYGMDYDVRVSHVSRTAWMTITYNVHFYHLSVARHVSCVLASHLSHGMNHAYMLSICPSYATNQDVRVFHLLVIRHESLRARLPSVIWFAL